MMHIATTVLTLFSAISVAPTLYIHTVRFFSMLLSW